MPLKEKGFHLGQKGFLGIRHKHWHESFDEVQDLGLTEPKAFEKFNYGVCLPFFPSCFFWVLKFLGTSAVSSLVVEGCIIGLNEHKYVTKEHKSNIGGCISMI